MSWYVRTLLSERDVIVANICEKKDDGKDIGLYDEDFCGKEGSSLEYTSIDYDNNVYDDLLTVEIKIKELVENNTLSLDEQRVLDMVLTYSGFPDIVRNEDISRPTLTKRFNEVCSRVAYHLGGYFTDEGYINMLVNKYNFSDKQLSKLKEIMKI